MIRSLRLLKPQPYSLPFRPRPAGLPTNLGRPTAPALLNPLNRALVRTYATGPSTSQDEPKKHMDSQNKTLGVRDELKGVTGDFAKIVAGSSREAAALGARETSSPKGHPGSIAEDFVDVTSAMYTAVPKPALYFGLAGSLPYLGTSLGTVWLAREASIASAPDASASMDLPTILQSLHTLEHVQITYGAILLSFLGAIHWGMEFSKLGGEHGYKRLALGVAPVLFAWPTTFLTHGVALAVQWFGFTGMWYLDSKASGRGWTTPWYSTYRFYLSIVVGFSIIGTLVGTSLYGAGAGATVTSATNTAQRVSALKQLDKVGERNRPEHAVLKGTVGGDIQVEEADEAFLKLRNVAKEEEEKQEEKKKQEEESKKKAAEQDSKEKEQKDQSPDGMKDDQKKRTEGGKKVDGKEEKKDEGKKEDSGDKKSPKQSEAEDQDAKKKEAAEEKNAAGNPNTRMR